MLEAKSCLEARGVAVYPEPVRNVDELLAAIESSVDDQAAVLIHAGTESGIVDGQVSDLAHPSLPPRPVAVPAAAAS